MQCVAIKKDRTKCGNAAKFGDLCGVHNNSKKLKDSKTSSSGSKKLTNLEKFEKHVKKIINQKKKSYGEKLDNPSRRRSA